MCDSFKFFPRAMRVMADYNEEKIVRVYETEKRIWYDDRNTWAIVTLAMKTQERSGGFRRESHWTGLELKPTRIEERNMIVAVFQLGPALAASRNLATSQFQDCIVSLDKIQLPHTSGVRPWRCKFL